MIFQIHCYRKAIKNIIPYTLNGDTLQIGPEKEWVSEWLSLTAFLEQRTARSI